MQIAPAPTERSSRARFPTPPSPPALPLSVPGELHVPWTPLDLAQLFWASVADRRIRPTLQAVTLAEFDALVEQVWPDFVDALEAFWGILRAIAADADALASLMSPDPHAAVRASIVKTADETAGLEFDFAAATIRRTATLAQKAAAVDREPRDPARDAELRRMYLHGSARYTFATTAFSLVTTAAPLPAVLVDPLLSMCRKGALETYCAVREAIDLRRFDEVKSVALDDDDRAASRATAELGIEDARTIAARLG